MVFIILALLVVAAGYFLWKSYDKETKTFNWSNGIAGIGLLAAAVWAYLSDSVNSLFQ